MNVLIVGGGGREHALAKMANRSHDVRRIFCDTSNAGIRNLSKYVEIKYGKTTIKQVKHYQPELTIIGSEVPLAEGLAGEIRSEGFAVFGPSGAATQIEASKMFGKEIMWRAGVKTAEAIAFYPSHFDEALEYAWSLRFPVVIKLNGLAGGKGVKVCNDKSELLQTLNNFMTEASTKKGCNRAVLVEKFLEPDTRYGRPEVSVFSIVDKYGNIVMLPPAQDYKRALDGDKGDNTGGMGSIAGLPWMTDDMLMQIKEEIFQPVVNEMKAWGTPFSGLLYGGLMLIPDGWAVVEFNARFGDPEIQPISCILNTDIIPILHTVACGGSIEDERVGVNSFNKSAVSVVISGSNYPKSGSSCVIIPRRLLKEEDGIHVFHAGTMQEGENVVTAGGRILAITGIGTSVENASERAYEFIKREDLPRELRCRWDIGVGV